MTPETPQELPPTPESQSDVTRSAEVLTAAELEAKADRYNRIMRISAITGAVATGYAAVGEFVSEVAGDVYTNAPLAEWSYIMAGTLGLGALAASLGARFSRDGYWEEASEQQALDGSRD